jgi:predicted cupin superfamily sugar epimerase
MASAAEVIARLELRPHPEGGYYRETFRDKRVDGNGARIRPRSITCWRAAIVRTGIASMRSRYGTIMRARR